MSEKKERDERKTIKDELSDSKLICTITFGPKGVSYEHDPRLQGMQLVNGLRGVVDSILIQAAISAFEQKMAMSRMLAERGLIKQ